jgi:hypothetical protein
MKKEKLILFLLLISITSLKAQLAIVGSVEGGFAGTTLKTDELPIFINSYNTYNSNGLTTPFKLDVGMATGRYFHIMAGIGGDITKATVGFGQYLVRTPFNEARFSNGEGRDISVEVKDASTETGINFGVGRFTAGFQFDMILRTVSIYSEYIFPDGSRSLCLDHTLNGIFTSNRLQVGTGVNIGFRIIKHVFIVAKCDYVFQTDKSHPEYHQYQDLQQFKTFTPDYLPRDMNDYVNNPFNSVENSISNDIRGLRFGFGIQVSLAHTEE